MSGMSGLARLSEGRSLMLAWLVRLKKGNISKKDS